MQHLAHSAARGSMLLALALSCSLSRALPGKEVAKPTVRWDESNPGCTFSRSDDGKYRYGLWAGDVGVTLAVDSQELGKVHRRPESFFSAWLSLRYRGTQGFGVNPGKISLEFVTHFKVTQAALDPDGLAAQVQQDADDVDRQAAREIEKHPELKASKEAYVRAYQKESAELLEFVSRNSLRAAHLDPGKPEISGWVMFSTKNKFIGGWKKQEEFILRVPVEGKIFEFPFKLPPKEGELLLRHR